MVEYMTECPCCNRQLKVIIDETSGKVLSTSFFDKHNKTDDSKLLNNLEEKGLYFGLKGGG